MNVRCARVWALAVAPAPALAPRAAVRLERAMERPRTICVNCAHHFSIFEDDGTHDGTHAGPPPSTWYYQYCGAVVAEKAHIDPVTGKVKPIRYEYCRNVNRVGQCKNYVERSAG